METLDIKIPQMGEGLTEVRLIQFLKSPGDTVARDELIYTMETDKATLEVESPHAGTLTEWLASEGDVLPIGAAVARIQSAVDQTTVSFPAEPLPPNSPALRPLASERIIPPRTRAYARELGLSDETLALIPSATARLMPSDLDNYNANVAADAPKESQPVEQSAQPYEDRPLPARQRTLNFHMKRSSQVVVPGTVSRPIEWTRVRNYVEQQRGQNAAVRPTEFQTFAFCVVQATRNCPKFRCSLIRDDTVRQYECLNLGVAVALPDGELTTAVLPAADKLPLTDFISSLHERVRSARAGSDQADATVQMHLTYLGAYGIRDAVPVLVSPAVAVLFIGEAYTNEGKLLTNVSLTFDHRLINGVEAADLLNATVPEMNGIAAPTVE